MSKIIKLKESDLKKIVQKVISEQTPNYVPNATYIKQTAIGSLSPAASLIRLGYKGGGTRTDDLTKGFLLIKDVTDFDRVDKEIANLGEYKSLADVINGELEDYEYGYLMQIANHLKSIGVYSAWVYKGTEKNPTFKEGSFKITSKSAAPKAPAAPAAIDWNSKTDQERVTGVYCSVVNGIITVDRPTWKGKTWNEYLKTATPQVTKEQIAAAKASCPNSELAKVKPKSRWVKNNGFPLMWGQYGGQIGTLQSMIGAYPDKYFGNKTEAMVKLFYPQYDRKVGVTQDIFNSIQQKRVSDISQGNKSQLPSLPNYNPAQKLQSLPKVNTQLTPQQQADIERIMSRPDYGTPTPPPEQTNQPPSEEELQKNPSTNNPY